MQRLEGTFYRVIFARDMVHLLSGANAPEGRFHHDGQAALYLSASPEGAAVAIATYLRPDDPPRVMVLLAVTSARILDLRQPDNLGALGLSGHEPSAKWQEERAQGLPATSWRASDSVRKAGADGMIYASRKAPELWHLVLFNWNQPGHAQVAAKGAPADFHT